jgi:hypothetical protein
MTREHYHAFGGIIHGFARIEVGLQMTLAAITGIDAGKLAIITRGLSYAARRDTLYSYMEIVEIDEDFKARVKGFFDAVHEYSGLRNHIAHSLWTKGIRPNTIRPLSVRVQGGKGRFYGLPDSNDVRDYTLEELGNIALKLAIIHNSHVTFLRTSGLIDSIDEKIRASIEESTSAGGTEDK